MDLRVAAYAVIVDAHDRLLLAHWNEGRRAAWTMPGGGLEPGEDPERAARREVREAPGVTEPLHTLRVVYRASVIGGRLRNEKDGSTDRAEWFPLDEVRTLQRVKLVDIALEMAAKT
jgi:8-oxo-dGTP diphosphatase